MTLLALNFSSRSMFHTHNTHFFLLLSRSPSRCYLLLSLNEFIHSNCGLIQSRRYLCSITLNELIGCRSMECLHINLNWWKNPWVFIFKQMSNGSQRRWRRRRRNSENFLKRKKSHDLQIALLWLVCANVFMPIKMCAVKIFAPFDDFNAYSLNIYSNDYRRKWEEIKSEWCWNMDFYDALKKRIYNNVVRVRVLKKKKLLFSLHLGHPFYLEVFQPQPAYSIISSWTFPHSVSSS